MLNMMIYLFLYIFAPEFINTPLGIRLRLNSER
jgi:hypothetical protein